MAKILSNNGIITGQPVEAHHVSQSVNALTGAEAYDISISGSLDVIGSSSFDTATVDNDIIVGGIVSASGAVIGDLTYPTTDDIAGYVVATDGSGSLFLNSGSLSSSFATSASVADYATTAGSTISSSYALTANSADIASTATSADTASIATTASYVTSSNVDGPLGFDSVQSASFALTASYVEGGFSATASYVTGSDVVGIVSTASLALTASYIDPTNLTASYIQGTGSGYFTGSFIGDGSSLTNIGAPGFQGQVLVNSDNNIISAPFGLYYDTSSCGLTVGGTFPSKTTLDVVGKITQRNTNNSSVIGFDALNDSYTGVRHVAIGDFSLVNSTTGNCNIAIGYSSMQCSTANSNNIALGIFSLQNSTGDKNIAIGHLSLNKHTQGDDNITIGYRAANFATCIENNVLIGKCVALNTTTACCNTIIGNNSGIALTSGKENTIIGNKSGDLLTAGNQNVIIGAKTGNDLLQGSSGNVLIGYNVQPTGTSPRICNNILKIGNNCGAALIEGVFGTPTTAQLNIRGALTASGLIYPDIDGTSGSFLVTDGDGKLSFSDNLNLSAIEAATSGALTNVSYDSSNTTFTFSKANGTSIDITHVTASGTLTDSGSFIVSASNDDGDNVITFVKGDGSTFDVSVRGGDTIVSGSGSFTHTQSISSSTWTVEHNLETAYPVIELYNTSNQVVTASNIVADDENTVTVTFDSNQVGYATVIAGGGGIITRILSTGTGSSYVHTQSSGDVVWTVNHSFNFDYPSVTVYNSDEEIVIPNKIVSIDEDTTQITFTTSQSGYATITKGGGLLSGSAYVSSSVDGNTLIFNRDDGSTHTLVLDALSGSANIDTGSFYISSSISGDLITFNQGDGSVDEIRIQSLGLATGSAYIFTQSSPTASWHINHNFDQQYPTITVFDGSDNVIIPSQIKAVDTDNIVVTFSSPQSGHATIALGGAASGSASSGSVPSGTISSSQQIEDLGFITSSAGAIDTGSFYYSSSIDGSTITFFQGDGTSEDIIIESSAFRNSGSAYIHTQTSPLSTWTVNHNFNEQYPIVNVYDSSDEIVLPSQILAVDANTLSITFPSPQSGHATVALGKVVFDDTSSFAVTSSNQFTGSQFFTGSLIPKAIGGNGIYDVGSQTHPWRDLYISTSSLKFVRDAVVIADLNGEDDGVRIGNIFIGTGSISVVSGSGDDMTIIGDVINTEISGGIITPIVGDAILPTGSISSSAQISELGFISASSNGVTEFSGSTSFVGDTTFSGSTEFSGSVIALKGIRAEGNSVMTGSVIIDGEFTLESNSTSTFNTDLEISGSSTQEGNSIITGSLTTTGGITGSLQGTATNSLDSLLLDGKDSATFATTGSNTFKSSQYISGSVVIAPSEDPGTGNLNATYLFTSASNFGEDECDFYYRNKGILWDQEWLEYGVGSGLIYGGVVTFSGTDLYVSPGGGLVVNYNAETGSANAVSPTQVKWGPITSSATFLTSSQYSHLYIDENGDLQQQIEDFTTQQYLEKIPLGTLGHLTNAYIDAFGEEKQTTYAGPAQANQFIRAFGPLKQQGYDLSPITSSLGFNAASGITYKLGGFYSKDPNNPSVYDTPALASTGKIVRVSMGVGDTFIGDINAGNFYDTIDPTKYDDGSGTLVNISGSTTTIQRVFLGPTSERFYVYYGQDTYDSVSTALQNLTTEPFTESLTTSKSLTFIGYLVVQANTTDLSDESFANIINAGLFRNTAGSSGGGTSTISNLGDITDVDILGPVTGEYLKYNAGIWENSSIQYSEVNNAPSGIISSSVQLESLGVSVSSGSNTTFGNNVVISGSNSTLEVQGDLQVTGSLSTKTQVTNPSFTPLGWALTIPVSTGNFFETTLPPTVNTIGFGLTGGYTGQTINLKVNQSSPNPGTITWGSNVEFADGFDSAASTGAGDIDVWSFVTFDGSTWYGTGLKNFS